MAEIIGIADRRSRTTKTRSNSKTPDAPLSARVLMFTGIRYERILSATPSTFPKTPAEGGRSKKR